MITSFSNKSVREVIQLTQKSKVRNRQDVFIVEGTKMFAEAPAERIERVYLAQRAEKELRETYGEKLNRVPCEIVADDVFDKMSDTKTPQGILTLVRQYHYRLEELLAGKPGGTCVDKRTGRAVSIIGDVHKKNRLYLIVEDIQDPGNLGTMIRTAEGAGASGVILSRGTVDIYNPKTIRSTMGSLYRVPFVYVENICETIHILQKNNTCVYAAHLDGKEDYDACDYHKGTAFLIGNEGNGLREETAACAEKHIVIPMEGSVESLNAATASTVLLYEAYRQRRS